MSFYVPDTDHISLFQRRHPQIVSRLLSIPLSQRTTTITTVEEQLRGRLNQIRKARMSENYVKSTAAFHEAVRFFAEIRILDFDEEADTHFKRLKKAKINIGSQDLRIAAIVLSRQSVLVTRNRSDFEKVPALRIGNWAM